MAVAHVVSVSAKNVAGDNAVSAAVDTSGASLIVLGVSWQNTSLRGFQTDVFGNYYTPLTYSDSANNGHCLFFCVNPRCGPGHVFTNYGTINTRIGFVASAFSGTALWDVWTRVETGATINGTGAVLAVPTLTPLRNNCLVVVGASHQTTSFSIDGGFTIADQHSFLSGTRISYGGGLAYLVQTTAAASAPTVTYSASTWGAVRQTYFVNSPYVVLSNGKLLNAAPNYSVKQMYSTAAMRNPSLGARLAGTRNYHGGTYHIAGFTTCDEEYVARTVYLMRHYQTGGDSPLFRANPADIIAAQRTVDGVGAFDFQYLQPGNYTVISVDPAGLEDDVIRTNIPAVAM